MREFLKVLGGHRNIVNALRADAPYTFQELFGTLGDLKPCILAPTTRAAVGAETSRSSDPGLIHQLPRNMRIMSCRA